jgi:hypothetical protein
MNILDNPLYYDKYVPNLITNNTMNELQDILDTKKIYKKISDINLSANIYTDYIQPHLFFIFITIIFILFLYWKYRTKQSISDHNIKNIKNKKTNKKNMKKNKSNIEQMNDMQFRAYFNPNVPVSTQNSYTNYLDNNNYSKDYTKDDDKYKYLPLQQINTHRDEYTGLFNKYNNSQDQYYNNPYGWEQNYNQSTYDAIEYATQKNRQNIEELNKLVDNTNNDIIKNLI